jgi:hypothetical protein
MDVPQHEPIPHLLLLLLLLIMHLPSGLLMAAATATVSAVFFTPKFFGLPGALYLSTYGPRMYQQTLFAM